MSFSNSLNENNSRIYQNLNNYHNLFFSGIKQKPGEQDQNEVQRSELQKSQFQRAKLTQRRSIQIKDMQINFFKSLSESKKILQIQNTYDSSEINKFMSKVRNLIQKQKEQITNFAEINKQRQPQLKIYTKKLSQIDELIKSTIGSNDQIKVFVIKRVLQILKNSRKIDSKNVYPRLVKQIDQIANIKYLQIRPITISTESQIQSSQQKQGYNKAKLLLKPIQAKYRQRRSVTLNSIIYKQLANNQEEDNQKPQRNTITSTDAQFEQILSRVDKIHQNHLKTWQKHVQQTKELEQMKQQIKHRKSTFNNKMFNNRRILLKSESLKVIPKGQETIKITNYYQFTLNGISSPKGIRSLSYSLPSVSEMQVQNHSKDRGSIFLKFKIEQKNNKKKKLKIHREGKLHINKISELSSVAQKKMKLSKKSKQNQGSTKINQQKVRIQSDSLNTKMKLSLLKRKFQQNTNFISNQKKASKSKVKQNKNKLLSIQQKSNRNKSPKLKIKMRNP